MRAKNERQRLQFIVSRHRDRARRLGLTEHFSVNDLLRLFDISGNRCAACYSKEKLAVDHVIALANGGTNTIDNLQVLCKICNGGKRSTTADYRSPDMVKALSFFRSEGMPITVNDLFVEESDPT